MKLLKSILIPLILAASLILASCAFLQPVEDVAKSYRVVTNPRTGVTYNIPAGFPNPFDVEEMSNFTSQQMPIKGGFVIAVYHEVDKNKDRVGTIYGLVFDPNSQMLLAAVTLSEDGTVWEFWIYPGDIPIPCTKEEQEAFIQERAYL